MVIWMNENMWNDDDLDDDDDDQHNVDNDYDDNTLN